MKMFNVGQETIMLKPIGNKNNNSSVDIVKESGRVMFGRESSNAVGGGDVIWSQLQGDDHCLLRLGLASLAPDFRSAGAAEKEDVRVSCLDIADLQLSPCRKKQGLGFAKAPFFSPPLMRFFISLAASFSPRARRRTRCFSPVSSWSPLLSSLFSAPI